MLQMKTNVSLNPKSREYVGNDSTDRIFQLLKELEETSIPRDLVKIVELKELVYKEIIGQREKDILKALNN